MDDQTLEVSHFWRYGFWLAAIAAELCWVVFPLMRRPIALSALDGLILGVAPVAFLFGVKQHRLGVLLVGVPLAWVAILPLAPRDGLGSGEVLAMAISLLAYLALSIQMTHRNTPGASGTDVVWTKTEKKVSALSRSGAVEWVIPVGVMVGSLGILAWPKLQLDLTQYPPGTAARLNVAMIFLMGIVGLLFTLRKERVQNGWMHRGNTSVFLILAVLFAILFAMWRLI